MVVLNDYILWASLGPHEADPPLVVDPDAVLTSAVDALDGLFMPDALGVLVVERSGRKANA